MDLTSMLLQPRVPVYTDYFTGFHPLIVLNAERPEWQTLYSV